MKKIIKFLSILLICSVCFLFGMKINDNFHADNIKNVAKKNNISNNIAIVNLDSGINDNNGYRNYSSSLVSYPKGFVSDGMSNAEDGLKNGSYSAYIVIPENFSKSVDSVNNQPVKSMISYKVNDKLSKQQQKQVLNLVVDYLTNLKNKVSDLYLNALLSEVHDGQNKSNNVLVNNSNDLIAVQSLNSNNVINGLDINDLNEDLNNSNSNQVNENKDDPYAKIVGKNNEIVNSVNNVSLEKGSDKLTNMDKDTKTINDQRYDQIVESITDKNIADFNEYIKSFEDNDQTIYVLNNEDIDKINKAIEEYNFGKLKFDQIKPLSEDDRYILDINRDNEINKIKNDEQLNKEKQNYDAEVSKSIKSYKDNVNAVDANNDTKVNDLKKEVGTKNDENTTNVDDAKKQKTETDSNNLKQINTLTEKNANYSTQVNRRVTDYDKNTKKNIDTKVVKVSGQVNSNKTTNEQLLRNFINKIPNSKINGAINKDYVNQIVMPVKYNNINTVSKTKPKVKKVDNADFVEQGLFIFILIILLIILILTIISKIKEKQEQKVYEEI